jgi:hypothetical protein
LGAEWFWFPFIAVIGTLVWIYMRCSPIVEAIAVGHLAVAVNLRRALERIFLGGKPAWVLYPVYFGILLFLAYAIAMIVYLRGARWFVALFALPNLYFMLAMSFLAVMAVTGDWL